MRSLFATFCLLWCSQSLAAPPKSKAAPNKAAVQSVKPPNPNGKKGGDAHQGKVEEVVAGVNESEEKVEEFHQVGRQTKSGQPVAREKKAMDDIQKATGKRPKFHPYN